MSQESEHSLVFLPQEQPKLTSSALVIKGLELANGILARKDSIDTLGELRFRGHTEPVNDVVWSFDSRYVISGSDDRTVRIWDTKTGCESHSCVHDRPVTVVAASSEGKYIAAGDNEGTIVIWDWANKKTLRRVVGGSDPVTDILFSGDSKWLYTVAVSGNMLVWNIQSGRLSRQRSIRWGPEHVLSTEGRLVASLGWDNSVYLFDTKQRTIVLELTKSGRQPLGFSPDGTMVFSRTWSDSIGFWNTTSFECCKVLFDKFPESPARPLYEDWDDLPPLGLPKMPEFGQDPPEAHIGSLPLLPPDDEGFPHICFPDLAFTVVGVARDNFRVLVCRYNEAHLVNLRTGRIEESRRLHESTIRSVAWSPNGNFAATGSDDTSLFIWKPFNYAQLPGRQTSCPEP